MRKRSFSTSRPANKCKNRRHDRQRRSRSRTGATWLLDTILLGPGLAIAALMFGRIFNLDSAVSNRMTKIDPALLIADGRQHLARTIRRERILHGWMAVGSFLLIHAGYYYTNR